MASGAADSYRARIELEDAVMTTARKMGAELDKLAKKFDNLARASKLGGKGGAAAAATAVQVKQIKTVADADAKAQSQMAALEKSRLRMQQRGALQNTRLAQKTVTANVTAHQKSQQQIAAFEASRLKASRNINNLHATALRQNAAIDAQHAKATAAQYPAGNANFIQRAQSKLINFNDALNNQQKITNRSSTALVQLKNKFLDAVPGVKRLGGAISAIKGWALNEVGMAIGVISRSLVRAAFWGAVGAVSGFFALTTKAAVTASVAYEQASKSFEAMLGKTRAGNLTEWTKGFAKTTPFQWSEVIQQARLLTAFNLDPKKWEKIVGDVSSAMGAGAQGMEELSTALGQIKAGGFGQGFRVLRRFGIGRERLEGAGIKFNKAGQAQASPEQVLAAIAKIAGQAPYLNQMQVVMGTIAGMWSNIKDQVWLIWLEMGQRMTSGIKRFMTLLKGGIENFTASKAYKDMLAFIDNVFSQASMDAAYDKLLHLVSWVEAGVTMMKSYFKGLADYFATGVITDKTAADFTSKILKWTAVALGLASAWHLFNAALWGTQIAASAGFNALAWIMAIKETASGLAAGAGAVYAGMKGQDIGATQKMSEQLSKDKTLDNIDAINSRIYNLRKEETGLRGLKGAGARLAIEQQIRALKAQKKIIGAGVLPGAGTETGKGFRELAAENYAQLKGKGGAAAAGGAEVPAAPQYSAKVMSDFNALSSVFGHAEAARKLGMADPYAEALKQNTDSIDENTASNDTASQRLEGIVQQIIGGGELARMGIAPADVARRRGYTDSVYSKGSGAQKATVPPVVLAGDTTDKLHAGIVYIAEQVVAQIFSGMKSYNTARTGG